MLSGLGETPDLPLKHKPLTDPPRRTPETHAGTRAHTRPRVVPAGRSSCCILRRWLGKCFDLQMQSRSSPQTQYVTNKYRVGGEAEGVN